MLILTITLVTIAVFVVLIVIAGIKGFFKGATEEFIRQHGVITRMVRKMRAKRLWKDRLKAAAGLDSDDEEESDADAGKDSE